MENIITGDNPAALVDEGHDGLAENADDGVQGILRPTGDLGWQGYEVKTNFKQKKNLASL